MLPALSQMAPPIIGMLIRHHADEVRLADLANADGRNPKALAQTLSRARRRIRDILRRRGVKEDDIFVLFAAS